MKFKLLSLLILIAAPLLSQETQPIDEEITINEFISGSLLAPTSEDKPPLVIIIAGSGPTDRNGNQSFLKNDSYKKLARGLSKEGIASFRYDKRILKAQELGIKESELSFNDFVTDAVSVLDHFREKDDYGKIILLGHSQGSLIGMLAAEEKADAFISIAGAGKPIDSIIVEQIAIQMPGFEEGTRTSFKEMREKGSTSSYNPMLEAIFRPSVQPFLLSWMIYDPVAEIAKLDIPVLILNGTNDFQVTEKEAELLKEANPGAKLVLLEGMNHVLTKIESDDTLTNSKSYNEPALPLHPELVPTISAFIKDLE